MFKRILIAISLDSNGDQLLGRVIKILQNDAGEVHVVHVLRDEACRGGGPGAPLDPDQKRRNDRVRTRLKAVLYRNGFELAGGRIHLRCGEPATEIKRLAHDLQADLVIVGSHSRENGWLNLPGATTNCVLQGIQSDVMAVRV
jgi:universal stress protein A